MITAAQEKPMTDLNKLAFNIATRMKEIDAYETSDHNRYECLWDAVLDEFSAVGMSLFGDEGEPIAA
jgi:hypothetical protein